MNKEDLLKRKQFQKHPNKMTDDNIGEISVQEQYIYACLKYYDGPNGCFPSLVKIRELCGASILTIRRCIDTLIQKGYISRKEKNRGFCYEFLKEDKNFSQIPKEFLVNNKNQLSFTDRAYLLSIKQYMFVKDGFGITTLTDEELAKHTGLSRSAITKINNKLKNKNLLTVDSFISRDYKKIINKKIFHLDDLLLAMCNKMTEIDNTLKQTKENVEDVQERVQNLESLVYALSSDKMKQFDIGSQEYEYYKNLRDKCLNDNINIIKL